ncbi:MAG: phage tail tape measure protein, partial [Planctomycetaceae bacterium]|nr:phage tail tape measure protein [Planctomycetaceae bacterium]
MADTSSIRAGRAFVELFADDSKLVRGLRNAETKVVQFGRNISNIGKRLMTLGAVMSVPLAGSLKTFSDFDDQMRAVKAVTNATGKEFDSLTNKAKFLGRTTSFTASQVASAMLELGRAGFAPQEIDNAIASVLDLARATGTELAKSAEICSNTLRSFELPATDMSRVCDVLVAAANNSAQTLEELGESMAYCSPIASEYGLSLEQTAKALGSLANYGIKGSQAGTTLRRILTNLADPSIQTQLRNLGVAVVDYNTGKMRDVTAILRDLGMAIQDMPKDQKLGLFKEIFGLYAIAGGAKLTVAHFDKLIKSIDNAAGTSRRAAKEMDSGIGGSLRMMWSAIEGVAIAIGESLAPTMKKITDWFTNATSGLADYITKNNQLILNAAKVIASIIGIGSALLLTGISFIVVGKSIGVVATTLATFANIGLVGISLVSGAITALTFSIGTIASALTATISAIGAISGIIVTIITSILSPIGLVVAALGAVGVACYLIHQNANAIQQTFATAFKKIISTINAILSPIKKIANTILNPIIYIVQNVVGTITTTFAGIASIIKTVLSPIISVAQNVVIKILSAFSGIASVIQTVFNPIANIVQNIVGKISTAFSSIVSIVRTVWSPIIGVVQNVVSKISTAFSGVASVVRTAFNPITNIVQNVVSKISTAFSGVASVVRTAFNPITNIVQNIIGKISTAFSSVASVVRTVWSPIIGIVQNVVSKISTAFSNVASIVRTVWSPIIGVVQNVVGKISTAFSSVASVVRTAFNPITKIIQNVVGKISTAFLSVASIVRTVWSPIIGVVQNVVGKISTTFASVASVVRTAFNPISNIVQNVVSKISTTFASIASVVRT